jgi:Ca2+-transporting ATPase
MVLTDDNFASIEAAVEEGRGVFANLKKFIAWTLPTNLGEGLVILAAVFAGVALPILPVQILWINMTTAVLLGLMLAFEPKEAGNMQRPPRPPKAPLLDGELISRIILVGALLLAGAFGLFELEQSMGGSLAEARTVAVNVFVFGEMFYLFNCRSLSRPSWKIRLCDNRFLLGGVALMAALQLLYTYLPGMNSLFGAAPISGRAWIWVIGVSLAIHLVVELEKWLRRRWVRRPPYREVC